MRKSHKNIWLRTIAYDAALLAFGAFAGVLALVAVYSLPENAMQEHVWRSLDMIEAEFERTDLVEGYPATMVGNFTDCLMLGNAVYDGGEHSVWQQAFQVYRLESGKGDGWAPGYSLVDYLCKNGAEQQEITYSRYWHGYLVVLKPLLCFMPFGTMRLLAAFVQFLMIGGVLMLCGERGERRLAAAYALSMPFFYCFALYTSLSLSICFYLMTFFALIQLKWHEKIQEKGWYAVFFFAAGMACAYFDFLTYPLVVLGFPLCTYLYLQFDGWKKALKRLLDFSVQWSAGYMGFWALKWILTDLFAGGDTIADAWKTLNERTDLVGEMSFFEGLWNVLRENVGAYANRAFVVLGMVIAVWCVNCAVRGGKSFWKRESLLNRGIILLVAFFPVVWFAMTQNHSYEHAMFTYKILALSVFAVCCAVGRPDTGTQRQQEND